MARSAVSRSVGATGRAALPRSRRPRRHCPARRSGRRLGAADRRPAPLEPRHRLGPRGGAAATAARPPRRARAVADRLSLGLRTAVRQLERSPRPEAVRTVARAARTGSPTRSTSSWSSSSGSCATCARPRSTSSASSAPSPSSPAVRRRSRDPPRPADRHRSSCRRPSRWRRTASSPRRHQRRAPRRRASVLADASPPATTVDIDVVDDGVGIGDGRRRASGWRRCANGPPELGGTCRVDRTAPHGTHVHVELPAACRERLGRIRCVAIVDDHPMFRMGLAAAIGRDGRCRARRRGRSRPTRSPTLVADAAPDVLLLDVRLADASGLEVNRWLAPSTTPTSR